MTKVMRKEARHTQRRERASGVPLEILEGTPPNPESAYFLQIGRALQETKALISAITGESRGGSRAVAPGCGFSRGTTARSVSLSWGAREVGSPWEWRGGEIGRA